MTFEILTLKIWWKFYKPSEKINQPGHEKSALEVDQKVSLHPLLSLQDMRKASSSTPMYLTELWRIGKNWQEKWDSKLGPRLEFYPKSIYFSFHFFLLGCSEKKMPVMILSIVIGTLSMYTEQLCWRVGLGLVIVPQNVNSLSIWINILRGSDENTDFTLKSLYFFG